MTDKPLLLGKGIIRYPCPRDCGWHRDTGWQMDEPQSPGGWGALFIDHPLYGEITNSQAAERDMAKRDCDAYRDALRRHRPALARTDDSTEQASAVGVWTVVA